MDAARPLRDVFADLAGDEEAHTAQDVLRDSGHADLPDVLVAEAVGTYADTAPVEVAEHLSPYVMAHSSVPRPELPDVDASGWLDAVVTAPVVDLAPYVDTAGLDGDGDGDLDADADGEADGPDAPSVGFPDADLGLDFGRGTGDEAGRDDAAGGGDAPDHADGAEPLHIDLGAIDDTPAGPAGDPGLDIGNDTFDTLDDPDDADDGDF